ncbi:kynureninase [Aureobasidium pullulans]|uniref:Kynureninase n=1 Tax=Aureobasidium pullulans TaxID=5580 RepID=A0A4S9DBU8_AURPU|nr:kynureninase [Aureobasidium pullulans]
MANQETAELFSESYAKSQDEQDPLSSFRSQFIIPTISDLHAKTLQPSSQENSQQCTYLCGNSLGLQPRLTAQYQQNYLQTWATKGVFGHFTEIEDSELPPWLHVDDDVIGDMCEIVGAKKNEVAVMQTLTANLHLAMASFYRPNEQRWKIIIEGKAFPSDHYAVESQLLHHNQDPATSMILLEPEDPQNPILSTQQILNTIDKHADTTALLLLPGIQFYTGQFFDIPTITAHAQKKGIVVGWDLAHAAGNLPLKLHEWNVDFAAWCSYKYLNCGPGSIGGLFVHERHSQVSPSSDSSKPQYLPRLSGWWGSDKSSRFAMENNFTPIAGAGGWQLSNPSVADMTALRASLDVFNKTSLTALRQKSVKLTGYLEKLLLATKQEKEFKDTFTIITPSDPEARGAQLSIRLAPGLLDHVMHVLEQKGVVVDERRPDVIRVAPAPLYNSWQDVLRFMVVFKDACKEAANKKDGEAKSSVMVEGGKEDKGWSEVK